FPVDGAYEFRWRYSNSLSWRTENTPNPPEIRPRAVFDRMFGAIPGEHDEKDAAVRERLRSYRNSILDMALGEAQSLKSALGGADRRSSENTWTRFVMWRSGFRLSSATERCSITR